MAALITALHRVAQRQLPVILVGAGLPQLPGRMGRAKSYADRLFDFPQIGPLNNAEAGKAITVPAREQQVEFEPVALERIVHETQGYAWLAGAEPRRDRGRDGRGLRLRRLQPEGDHR